VIFNFHSQNTRRKGRTQKEMDCFVAEPLNKRIREKKGRRDNPHTPLFVSRARCRGGEKGGPETVGPRPVGGQRSGEDNREGGKKGGKGKSGASIFALEKQRAQGKRKKKGE